VTSPGRRRGIFALREFRRPRLWLAAWLCLVALVVLASLLPPRNLPPAPFEGVDKLEHFLAYAALSAWAVMLFARRRAHAWMAVALIAMGLGLEWSQGAMTATRMADGRDAAANALGVLAGWAVGATPARGWLQGLDAWWSRRARGRAGGRRDPFL
jgi:VanZ family protein